MSAVCVVVHTKGLCAFVCISKYAELTKSNGRNIRSVLVPFLKHLKIVLFVNVPSLLRRLFPYTNVLQPAVI